MKYVLANSSFNRYSGSGEYLYKPWAFDTLLIYLYMCVILVSVNISE